MTLNYLERMKCYNELKEKYELQKIENGIKQEKLLEYKHQAESLKRENDALNEKIRIMEELLNDREYNTTNKKTKPRSSGQTKKI